MKKLLLLGALGALTMSAATVLTLNDVTTFHQFQQTTNSPCVIGDASCNNPAGFTYTLIGANAGSYDAVSPNYTVAQLTTLLGGTGFWVGVDINQSNIVQTLSLFTMSVNNVVQYIYDTTPTGTLVPPTTGGGNGNGYADYTLRTFSLAGFQSTDIVSFHAIMPIANDGAEEFFLISTATPQVPEPMTLSLIGMGLIGLAFARRKFGKQ